MTNQEAIDVLKCHIEFLRNSWKPYPDKKVLDALVIGISAIKKQIQKVPDVYGDGYSDGQLVYDMYSCPNCGENYEIESDHYDYCPKCGQHMDKSDKVFE